MAPVFRFLGLEVGVIKNAQSSEEKRAAMRATSPTEPTTNSASITARQSCVSSGRPTQRKLVRHHRRSRFDLIDEARTPLIISGPPKKATELYIKINTLIPRLRQAEGRERAGRLRRR